MNQPRIAILGLLAAVTVVTVACGPTDTGISTQAKTNSTGDESVKAAQPQVADHGPGHAGMQGRGMPEGRDQRTEGKRE